MKKKLIIGALALIIFFSTPYGFNIFISADQFVNTLFGGDPDETVSSTLGKHLLYGDCGLLCELNCLWLDVLDDNHCVNSVDTVEGSDQVRNSTGVLFILMNLVILYFVIGAIFFIYDLVKYRSYKTHFKESLRIVYSWPVDVYEYVTSR